MPRLKSILVLMIVAVVMAMFVAPSAEAKRLGGGMNFGKSYKYSRPVPKRITPKAPVKQSNAAKRNAVNSNAAGAAGRGGRGGLMGMLGGLAAGGLLAALFFGGAFENINFFDILLLGALAFGAVMLFRLLRGGGNRPQRGYETLATPGGYPPAPTEEELGPSFDIPEIGQALEGEKLSENPPWFDKPAFMADTIKHFLALQKAWDDGDLEVIREYTTPEMFEALKAERDKIPGRTQTQIMDLRSEMLDLLRDGDKIVAAILYHGYEQEGKRMPQMFSDIWHVEHPADGPEGNWLLAGIRKVDIPQL